VSALTLPQLVSSLLGQSTDPRDIPSLPDLTAGGWCAPLIAQVLELLATADPDTGAAASFTGDGHTHLLLRDGLPGEPTAYLRLPAGNYRGPRSNADTVVMLTLTGTFTLRLYRHQEDVDNFQPQYVRAFEPESMFACHAGIVSATESSADGIQLVLARRRLTAAGDPLAADGYLATVKDAQAVLRVSQRGTASAFGGAA